MLQSIGLVVVTLGILALVWGILQKLKAGRVVDAPLAATGDVVRKGRAACGPKGQISAQGNVVCQQPLVAPFSGTPCLYYRIKCTAEWKEGDTTKSKVLDEHKVAAQFAIDDGTGPVWVDAREGGDFEPTQRKRETKGTGLLGGITGTDLAFGNYRVSTGMLSMGTKYSVEEEVLPLVPRLYACGKLGDQGGAIASPSFRQLILSSKSRDELLASAAKGAKIFLAAGAAAFLVGSGMATVGHFLADDDAPVAAAPPAPEPKSAPPVVASAAPTPAETAPPPPSATVGTTRTTSATAKGASRVGAKDAGAPKAAPSGAPSGAASAKK